MNNQIPDWFHPEKLDFILDAREMLSRGEHPMAIILSKVEQLKSDCIIELITAFVPFPLIEKVEAAGLLSHTTQISTEEYHTYFYKK